MAVTPCSVNPVKDEHRPVIWKWMRENGIDKGADLQSVIDGANRYFFGGQAKKGWIEDLIAGRKAPMRNVTNEMWKAQYNRRLAVQKAQALQDWYGKSGFSRAAHRILAIPRAEAVLGHFGVFMQSHAGNLLYTPEQWGVYFRGQARQIRGAFSRGYTEKVMTQMENDPRFSLATQGGLAVKPDITAGGFLSGQMKGPSLRAWQAGLTVTRFQLWKQLMNKWTKAGMSDAETLALSKEMAEIANHATGHGRGKISQLGSDVLFGPALTEAKIQSVTRDPIKTMNTFRDWKNASYAQRAAAWERLNGATQYLVSKYGALAINHGLLAASGSDQQINFTDPLKPDWLQYKGAGLRGRIGTIDPELRLLGGILASSFYNKQRLAQELYAGPIAEKTGMKRTEAVEKIALQYAMSKLQPGIELAKEAITREDWRGKTITRTGAGKGEISAKEYAISKAPIVAEGPAKYVYDQLTGNGLSSSKAMQVVKGLLIQVGAVTGIHIAEEKPPKPSKTAPVAEHPRRESLRR